VPCSLLPRSSEIVSSIRIPRYFHHRCCRLPQRTLRSSPGTFTAQEEDYEIPTERGIYCWILTSFYAPPRAPLVDSDPRDFAQYVSIQIFWKR
jgi:hypothetical protein